MKATEPHGWLWGSPGGGADRLVRGNRRVRAEPHDRAVDDQHLGALLRAIRIRRRLRQADVAAGAGVDRSWISRIERGHLRDVSIGRLGAIARVLEVGLDIVPSWRGGEVARVINERHARLHELFAAHLARTPGWEFATEVSFSSWGERGVIDILAWHAVRRVLLVIELKTEIPDPANLIAQVDRYRRLAPGIGRDRGWDATSVATWVLLAESDMNRRQLARHRVMLRNAFPLDGRTLRRWLRNPVCGGAGRAWRVGRARRVPARRAPTRSTAWRSSPMLALPSLTDDSGRRSASECARTSRMRRQTDTNEEIGASMADPKRFGPRRTRRSPDTDQVVDIDEETASGLGGAGRGGEQRDTTASSRDGGRAAGRAAPGFPPHIIARPPSTPRTWPVM